MSAPTTSARRTHLSAASIHSFASNWPAHQVDAWVAVSMLLVYMVVFGLSWGPVPWAMPAEIFPSSLRAKGVALSTLSNWFFVSPRVGQRGAIISRFLRGIELHRWVDHASARGGYVVRRVRLLLRLCVPVDLLGPLGMPGDGGCSGAWPARDAAV